MPSRQVQPNEGNSSLIQAEKIDPTNHRLGKAMSVQSGNPGATLTVAPVPATSETVALKCTRLHLIAPQKMKLRFSSRPRLGGCGATEPGTWNHQGRTLSHFLIRPSADYQQLSYETLGHLSEKLRRPRMTCELHLAINALTF
jgi:hypothetical protein